MFDSLRSQFSRKLKRLKALLFAVALTLQHQVWLAEVKPKVVATLAMIAEPVEWVASGRQTDVSAGNGGRRVDPHLYRATRSDIAKLAQADLILWNGLDLEAQLEDALVSLGDRTTVVAVERLLKPLQTDEEGKQDPHLWMDPALWRAAITVAVQSLKDVDPDNAAHYAERLDLYLARLDQLDAYAETAMATVPADAPVSCDRARCVRLFR